MVGYHYHELVFNAESYLLRQSLSVLNEETRLKALSEKDSRGNTALRLAILLQDIECVSVIMSMCPGALFVGSSGGWSIMDSALACGNLEILSMLYKEWQKHAHNEMVSRMPALVDKLSNMDDFHIKLEWAAKSWVPFVSKYCPNDTYHIYKRGVCMMTVGDDDKQSEFRVDTTLIGYQDNKFIRGHNTFLMKMVDGGVRLVVLDNVAHQYYDTIAEDKTDYTPEEMIRMLENMRELELGTAVVNVAGAKSKRMIGWFGGLQSEVVNGYNCDIWQISHVHSIVKRRFGRYSYIHNDDLAVLEKRHKQYRKKLEHVEVSPVEGIYLNPYYKEVERVLCPKCQSANCNHDDPAIRVARAQLVGIREWTWSDYAVSTEHLGVQSPRPQTSMGIGRGLSREQLVDDLPTMRVIDPEPVTDVREHSYSADVWVSKEFPLSIGDILPILEVVTPSNHHFGLMKNFLEFTIPEGGFPVKIVAPTVHVELEFVKFEAMEVDPALMTIPEGYVEVCNPASPAAMVDDDDVQGEVESSSKPSTLPSDNTK